jgi:putative SWIM zinc finger domain protein
MSGIYLPRLFPPHIAERGLLYFQQGKVGAVQKTSAGRYRAEVCGSENYSVWLKLDSDLYIKDGGCDCPYGGACKHMAALWYAVRAQTPDGQPDESDAQQPKQGGNPYRQQLSQIFSRARYYDYYEAADLGFRLQNWLEDVAQEGAAALAQALPLLIPRLQDAFEKADDSDGMLGDAMYMAIDLLEEAVMENVTKRLINFLDKCLDDSRYFDFSEAGNKIYQIRARIWRLRGEWQAWQDYVAKRLAATESGWEHEFWAFEGWQVLQAKGDTAAAQDYFRRHLRLPKFRQIAVEQTVGQKDWTEAERLLREGISIAEDEGTLGTAHKWKLQLFDVLKETGKNVREIAADLAFSTSLSLPHYEAWKATFSTAEWPHEFNRLLARLSGQYSLQAEILEHEQEFDRLLALLQQHLLLLYPMDRFAPSFPEPYHDRIVACYLKIFAAEINKASNRKQYRQLLNQLKTLRRQYSAQRQVIEDFANEIRERYSEKPRRPALLEELDRAGF